MKKRQLSTCWVMDSNTFQRSVRKAGELEGNVLQMLQGLINLFIRHESWYETMAYDGCFWLSVMRFHFAQLTDPNSPASTRTLAETHTNDHQPNIHIHSKISHTQTQNDTDTYSHTMHSNETQMHSTAFFIIFLCPSRLWYLWFSCVNLGFQRPKVSLDTSWYYLHWRLQWFRF